MLQSSLLQFHNPTHRNTGASDPHSNHITGRVVVWGIFRHGLCIRNAKLNKELLKMLYFHSRGGRQFLGEQGNADWRRHADPRASNCQGQRVSSRIHHRICILTHDTHHILWLYERPQVIKYVGFVWVCDALNFKGCVSQNGSLERWTWRRSLSRWRRTGHGGRSRCPRLCRAMYKNRSTVHKQEANVSMLTRKELAAFLLPGSLLGIYHKPQ